MSPNAQGTCDPGCPSCLCAAPNTLIATPNGERRIADLRVGDAVYSVDGGRVRTVSVTKIRREPVKHHRAIQIHFDGGRALLISASHPLADGRLVADVRRGDMLFGITVSSVELVPYDFEATYDILPDSDTGTYFASGVLMGSTLFGRIDVPAQSFSLNLPTPVVQ